jgi:hypothetical protein
LIDFAPAETDLGIETQMTAIVADIPRVAARLSEKEQRVVELCQSPDCSLEQLKTLVRTLR